MLHYFIFNYASLIREELNALTAEGGDFMVDISRTLARQVANKQGLLGGSAKQTLVPGESAKAALVGAIEVSG